MATLSSTFGLWFLWFFGVFFKGGWGWGDCSGQHLLVCVFFYGGWGLA